MDTFVKALPVDYSVSYPVVEYGDQMGRDLITKAFLTKAKEWEYENERRIFEKDRAGQYMSYSPSALVGLILGAKISSEDEATIRALLIEREERRHPPLILYRSCCQISAYAVNIYKA